MLYLKPTTTLCIIAVFLTTWAASAAEFDWNQWRGPNRDGIAIQKMEFPDHWPKEGPPLVWLNEEIPSEKDGGYGSVSIYKGKGYLYVNWKHRKPIEERTISKDVLKDLGWDEKPMPEGLYQKVEAVRLSKELSEMNHKERNAYIGKWIDENMNSEEHKPFAKIAKKRLSLRDRAATREVLDKLQTILDKEFPSQEALNQWYEKNEIPKNTRNRLSSLIPRTFDTGRDAVFCFNLDDGSIIWVKEYQKEEAHDWGTSSTPTIIEGNVYAAGSKRLYCLDAATGEEKWQTDLDEIAVCSSPLVVDGVVATLAGRLKGFDAKTGEHLWTNQDVSGKNPSPSIWENNGKKWILCNGWTMGLVDPKSGKTQWAVKSSGNGTAAVSDDIAVVLGTNDSIGLAAWRLTEEKPEPLWKIKMRDRGTTPVIYDGYVYVLGGNKILCARLTDGKVMWEEKTKVEITSPVIAGDRLFAKVLHGRQFYMINPTPEKFDPLSEIKVRFSRVVIPVIQDGKMYMRVKKGLACYDLTAKAQSEETATVNAE